MQHIPDDLLSCAKAATRLLAQKRCPHCDNGHEYMPCECFEYLRLCAAIRRAEKATRPSRREQRRARKAAKNLVMYKTFGRRPWRTRQPGEVLDGSVAVWSVFGDNPLYRAHRLKWLREPSGFKAMSKLAGLVALDAKLAALNAKHQASMAKLEADGINIYADSEHM